MRAKPDVFCICIAVSAICICSLSGCISSDFPLMAVWQNSGGEGIATEFTVPYGRFGDRLAYGINERVSVVSNAGMENDSNSYDPSEYISISNDASESFDEFMNKHLVYRVNHSFLPGNSGLFNQASLSYAVDMDSNDCISTTVDSESFFWFIWISSKSDAKLTTFERSDSLISPYTGFQGKRIAYGEAVEGDSSTVASDLARINGYDCIGCRKSCSSMEDLVCLIGLLYGGSSNAEETDFEEGYASNAENFGRIFTKNIMTAELSRSDDEDSAFLGDGNFESMNVSGWIEYWLNSTTPYPILIEAKIAIRAFYEEYGNVSMDLDLSFVLNYVPGNKTIPIGSCGCKGNFDDKGHMERTPWNGFAPADGVSCKLDYPLSEAVDSAKNELLNRALGAYLESHPDAYLQSATYYIANETVGNFGVGPTTFTAYSWHLIFSDWEGDGFELTSTKRALTQIGLELPPENTYDGEMAAYAIPNEIFGESAPTLQCAILAWRAIASGEYAPEKPNFVSWGIPEEFYLQGAYEEDWNLSDYFSIKAGYIMPDDNSAAGLINDESGSASSLALVGINPVCLQGIEESSSSSSFSVSGSTEDFVEAISKYSINENFEGSSAVAKETIAIGAGALSLMAILACIWPGIKWALAKAFVVPLYARFHGEEVLENKVRDRIFAMIMKNPGASMSDIMREADLSWSSAVYHLTVLEREKHVISVRSGRKRMFFPVEKSRDEYERDAVLKNLSTAEIYKIIRSRPGIIQKYISEEMGMKHPSVNWHIGRLKQAGLVREERTGRSTQYFPILDN